MLFCIQNVMGNFFDLQHFAQQFAHFHRSRTHQRRPAFCPQLFDLLDHRLVLFPFRLEDQVLTVFPDSLYIRGDRHDIQLVDIPKFRCLRFRRTGHPGQLVVHPEIVLQCNRSVRLRRCLDLHIFLCFDRLVQTVTIPPPVEDTARLFVHDLHLAFHYHVLDVFIE